MILIICFLVILGNDVGISGQAIAGTNGATKNVVEGTSSSNLQPYSDVLESVKMLTEAVASLSDRLSNMEDNFHLKFQFFGESIAREKISLENINLRLDILDYLSAQVKDFETRLEDEAVHIRNVLSVTNKDVKRLAMQFGHETFTTNKSFGDSKKSLKENADMGKLSEKRETSAKKNSSSEDNDIGAVVLQKVENVLPRLLAAELNHFYLNMATKTDYSISQLQTELVGRLRRIETMGKKSLTELQDGRQDLSHITHLQRTLIDKLPRGNENLENSCQDFFKSSQFEEGFRQMEEKLSSKITSVLKKANFTQLLLPEKDQTGKIDDAKQYVASDLWRGVFSTSLTRPPVHSTSALTSSVTSSKHCLDPAALAILEEVKQLLRTLMSKGEDLRRTFTEQAKEGVDLLKLLHQRFSVLLRRINTDPRHAEALLAEVQELEHLVENSYSSILLAQNLFIDACRQDQRKQPPVEGQIVDVLNKLVTNIDLGHQYNRKQLQEVRNLIEQMNTEEQSKNITFIPPWISQNGSAFDNGTQYGLSIFKANIHNKLILSVSEANSTEEKLQGIVERINKVEGKLQILNMNSGNVKNIVDELLTGAKDLKGYSRDQIVSLQAFQDDILKVINTASYNESSIPATLNSKDHNNGYEDENPISDVCLSSVIEILNSSLSDKNINNTILNGKQISTLVKEILSKSVSKVDDHKLESAILDDLQDDDIIDNEDNIYYDLDQKDDNNWFRVQLYGDDESYADDTKDLPENLRSKRRFSGKINAKNEVTILENEFNIH